MNQYINILKLVKQKRPYNEFDYIKYYIKQKDSYSLPSQSIQSILIVYNSYNILFKSIYINIYFGIVILLLCLTNNVNSF